MAASTTHSSNPFLPRGRSRLLALAATLMATAFAGGGPAEAEATTLPPQGLYEQCAPNSTNPDCGDRLGTMAAAGFTHVLNYTSWFGSAQEVQRYADQAAAAGVKLIWPLNDPAWRNGTDLKKHYRYLGPECGCSSNAGFKRFAIDLVKDHPATWGFYVGDEALPTPENIAQVGALVQEVKQLAPAKPTLYVALPREDITAQLAPYAPLADFAGSDYYPVGLEPDVENMAGIAEDTRQVTAGHGKQTVLVLQAFSWSQYQPQRAPRFPTGDEMLRMRNLAIRHGDPQLMLWYAFNDVMRSGDPASNWQNVREAAFAPYIQVDGPRRCAGRRGFAVSVRAASRVRKVRVLVDRKVVRKTRKVRFRVRVRGLKRGRHKLRVIATDSAGKRSRDVQKFRYCR